jgi:asparagine synthase (glutamine-hydrolysing)
MCGIAGTFQTRADGAAAPGQEDQRDQRARRRAEAMAGLIAHRGPDAEGFLVDGPVALANRRLAIIDLSPAGQQPLYNEDGSVGLVYNGELYNFQALRAELVRRGHRFRSHTDTEVVVHAYEEFGPACVRRFNGMFALALWDRRRGSLLLARDRFGVKPLYYTWLDGAAGRTLAISSEVKAFLALPAFSPSLDPVAAVEYLTFQNVYSDRTLFAGVRLLPAGSTLTVGADGVSTLERYWQYRFEAEADQGEAYYVKGVRDRFEEAVRRQLMSDVPVGSYLSGGMDSGSICAVASQQLPRLHTFTGGFPLLGARGLEQFSDERAQARRMATAMETEHHELEIAPGSMAAVLPELVWHLEDLRVASSYHNYLVAGLAGSTVKVVLAGAGGDELFAGYPWRYERALGARTVEEFARAYGAYWSILVPDSAKPAFLAGELAAAGRSFSATEAARGVLADYAAGAPVDDPLNLALTFEARTFLQGLFVVEDKLSMAHSLESRVPFLDNDLVDFACAMPSEYKLKDGTSKHVLRQAMRGLIPEDILWARKQGFAPPEDAWFRGPALPYLRETILSERSLGRGWFQPKALERVFEEHVAGTANHKKLLWSLACLEWWGRIFLDGERPEVQHRARRHAVVS